jgi:AraC family transcriptional regulator
MSGQQVSYGERLDRRGHLIPYTKEPGAISLYSGLLPTVHQKNEVEIVACALDTTFMTELAAEQETGFPAELREQVGSRDESLAGLIRLLEEEAKSGGLSGRLYVEHLTYALGLRLLSVGMKRGDGHIYKNALPHPRLRRVVERMEAELDTGLDLKTLALESGYSRNHFLRMFRAATGCTPHRYLLHLRVKRAQDLMKNKSMRLIDVALACGFSSHAHLSQVFRQMVGATPSEYRRAI